MLVRIIWLCSREKVALQTLKFFNILVCPLRNENDCKFIIIFGTIYFFMYKTINIFILANISSNNYKKMELLIIISPSIIITNTKNTNTFLSMQFAITTNLILV